MSDYIMVTDWEEVEEGDFYLGEGWKDNCNQESIDKARELQAQGDLYVGYVVEATNYVLYSQMDAHQIFIDGDGNEIISCEGQVIGDEHKHKEEFSY